MKPLYIIRFILFLFIFNNFQAIYSSDYGLYFHAHNVPIKQRTILKLNESQGFSFKKSFKMGFDFYLRKEKILYGNLLNLEADDNNYFRLIVLEENHIPQLAVTYKDQIIPLNNTIAINKWTHIDLEINKEKKSILIRQNNKVKELPISSNKYEKLFATFGYLSYMETAPFNLKDIHITSDNKNTHLWQLGKHSKNICLDDIELTPATAYNAYWLIDDHIQWKKIYTLKSKKQLDVTFNPQNEEFMLLSSSQIYSFNPQTKIESSTLIKGGHPAIVSYGHMLYDNKTNEILSYSFEKNRISRISSEQPYWSLKEKNTQKSHHFNHALAFNESDSCFYAFGGYGFWQYNNQLFQIDIQKDRILRHDYTPIISPRTASSSCIVNDTLFIFGGRGNELGKQEFKSHYYPELYGIDLKTMTSHKIWEKQCSTNTIMASTMYYEPKDTSFYAVSMSQGGVLWKIHKDSPNWEQISRPLNNDTIFSDYTYNLYSTETNLYLVLDNISSDKSHDVNIYSIKKPFLKEQDIIQNISRQKEYWSELRWTLLCILVLIVPGLYFCRIRTRKKTKKNSIYDCNSETPSTLSTSNEPEITYFSREKACISLLGTFHVCDKNGEDITPLFTPKLKSLLILIILFSEKNSEGISINKVLELLWPDKEDNSARNNLNVNLRKLRLLVEKIGNIVIVSENGFLYISWSDDVFCDYRTSLACMKQFREEEQNNNNELLNKILELMLLGPLLIHTELDWLDDFKEIYSSWSIDLLRELLKLHQDNTNVKLKIADIFFKHDPLSEEALAIKCETLIKEGKKGLAMNVYNHFCKDYKECLGEEYQTPINDLSIKY